MAMSELELLQQRVTRLEEELSRLAARDRINPSTPRFWAKGLRASMTAGMLMAGAAVAITFAQDVDRPTHQSPQRDAAPRLPPLDSLTTWGRTDLAGANAVGYTTEVLSLVTDGSQSNSYQWPLYVEMRGTTNGNATQQSSQSAGAVIRGVVRSPGSPWTAGVHSEIAHGETAWLAGKPVATTGTSIAFNGEIRSFSTGGVTTGLNLQCVYTDSTSKFCDNGINIQAGAASTYWHNGIHFEAAGNYSSGNIGINFDRSQYNIGIDLANNSLRMNAGQKFILDKDGAAYISYDATKDVVQIVRHGAVVASL